MGDQTQLSDAGEFDVEGGGVPEQKTRIYDNITLDQARIMTGDVGVENWQKISRLTEITRNKFGKDTRIMTGNVGQGSGPAFMEHFWK